MSEHKLIVNAYVFACRIEATVRDKIHKFANLAEARLFASRHGYTGIQIRFR